MATEKSLIDGKYGSDMAYTLYDLLLRLKLQSDVLSITFLLSLVDSQQSHKKTLHFRVSSPVPLAMAVSQNRMHTSSKSYR